MALLTASRFRSRERAPASGHAPHSPAELHPFRDEAPADGFTRRHPDLSDDAAPAAGTTEGFSSESVETGLFGLAVHALLCGLFLSQALTFPPRLLVAGLVGTGLFQLLSGLLRWRRGDAPGAVILGALGLFWLSLLPLMILPLLGLAAAPDGLSLTIFLAPWGLFALAVAIAGDELRPALRTMFAMFGLFVLLLGAAAASGLFPLRIAAGNAAVSVACCAIYALVTRPRPLRRDHTPS